MGTLVKARATASYELKASQRITCTDLRQRKAAVNRKTLHESVLPRCAPYVSCFVHTHNWLGPQLIALCLRSLRCMPWEYRGILIFRQPTPLLPLSPGGTKVPGTLIFSHRMLLNCRNGRVERSERCDGMLFRRSLEALLLFS